MMPYFYMFQNRLRKMRQVVNRFISEFIPDGDKVAIVEFNSLAFELSDLRTIFGVDHRNELLQRVPDSAGGGTCIGCGIRSAVQVFANINKVKNVIQHSRIMEEKITYASDNVIFLLVSDEFIVKKLRRLMWKSSD